ncbi:SRPBCC domain-containing protein [Dyadobacter sp. LHD-138]|uniref:SRPBCC family protein n=1 Tax=Dyadobacter sp. LHD-138 TaxID=3071413 RepID=UPI0027E1628A|nr:SRPBCC domain-containing protein [Dyadobacter sp. LHD-138]MDQ6480514.1 SRPBCC domain-containing protein [Dyadobacter sp. LHD-138]
MTKSIKHQFFFPHPPEMVWEYLTKSELMGLWLMKNNFQPIVGVDFQFQTNPIPSLDFDGIFYCKVLEIDPVKKLSYSWRSGPGEGEITLDSVVVWQLQRTEKGTALYLEHSGFEKEENLSFYNGLTDGWLKNLQKIANLLNAAPNGNTNA